MPTNVPQQGAPPPPPNWGNQQPGWGGAPPPPTWNQGPVNAGAARYGGFWIRFVAAMVDGIILSIPLGIVWVVLIMPLMPADGGGQQDVDPALFGALGIFVLASFVVAWLYEALLNSSSGRATWGKRMLGLQVLREDGAQLSFGRATGRFFAKTVVTNIVPLYIGYIMAGFTNRKRALHDMIANTVVIRAN